MSILPVPSSGTLSQLLQLVAVRMRRLDPATQERVQRLYAELRASYQPDATASERARASERFIDGLLGIDELRTDVEGICAAGAPDLPVPPELPERIEDLEPRQAARPPMAEAPLPPQPNVPAPKKTRSLKKAAKKNGGGVTRAAPTGDAREERPATERAPLTRYPDLDVPARIAPRTETSITFALRLEPPEPGTTAIEVADTAEAPPEVELVLSAPSFEIKGSNTQKVTVARDADVDARFVVIAIREGPAKIRVDIYQDGRRIGTASAQTVVGTGALAAAAGAPDAIEFASAGSTPPDLEILVLVDEQDPLKLHFKLHSTVDAVGYHQAKMGSITLKRSPLEELQLVYAELSKMAGKAPKTAQLVQQQRDRLASIGIELWGRLFSKEMQDAYWEWRDTVRSLLITSEEPWIPWEIVKPFRTDSNGQPAPDQHLCERFALTRWLSPSGPADRIAVRSLQPVAPKTSDLAAVDAELKAFEKLAVSGSGLTAEARCVARAELIRTFESGSFGILHVASHGAFNAAAPDNSSVTLSDGEVRPSDVHARFGGPRARPVVFINACHGGRLEHTFTGIGGWADRLVAQARVGAFIGASWEVNDRLALQFADTFYRALLVDHRPLGESFRIARTAIRDAEPSNSTWLAYVLYSDPAATVAVGA